MEGVTRELLTEYLTTWNALYPSSHTRAKMRDNIRAFLRYCYECQWLPRVPVLPKIQVDAAPTMPLTHDEFKRLLKATEKLPNPEARVRCHALFQIMRWSGLAITDALTLPKADLVHDKGTRRLLRHHEPSKNGDGRACAHPAGGSNGIAQGAE